MSFTLLGKFTLTPFEAISDIFEQVWSILHDLFLLQSSRQ